MGIMQVEDGSGTVTVRPTENMVVTVVGGLRDQLRPVLETSRPAEVYFDLGAVDMVDSSGIGLLIAVSNTLRKTGGVLKVVNARPAVYECLMITRLHRIFSIEKQDGE